MTPSACLLPPAAAFLAKKAKIVRDLATPENDYADASPKGSVDKSLRDLIALINRDGTGMVTTSSCSGRVSVYLEGPSKNFGSEIRKTNVGDGQDERMAPSGRKGGGQFLFVSHEAMDFVREPDKRQDWAGLFGLKGREIEGEDEESDGKGSYLSVNMRLVHFKFEPMILHVLTATPQRAQLLIKAGLEAGFRETGAINLVSRNGMDTTPMVAVRCQGLAFEAVVGVRDLGGTTECIVTDLYLRTLVDIARNRFLENDMRIARFKNAVAVALQGERKVEGGGWEDAQLRRLRKREEGLKRREVLSKKLVMKVPGDAEEPEDSFDEAVGLRQMAGMALDMSLSA